VRLSDEGIVGESIVLKIDVEGQELEVLRGASELFEAGRIKAVYLDGYKAAAVEDFLRRYDFQFFDGQTMQPVSGNVFSLLAVKPKL
jgi:hypothetical protein